jgi:hypothetical protein
MIQHWMEHVCVGCGAAYRYTTRRTADSQRRPKRSLRMRPCPVCGLYQPDMIAFQRSVLQAFLGAVTAGVAGFLGLFGWTYGAPEWKTPLIAAGFAVAALLGHGLLLLWNRNRNRKANREFAKRLSRAGLLERLRGETPELAKEELPRPRHGAVTALAFAGLVLGLLPFVTPELVRLAMGWPLNQEWHSGVVGPGDESRLYLAERISSIKGLWTGEARAEVLNAREVGLIDPALAATTHQDSWGNVIHFEQKERQGSPLPWADVRFPDVSRLGGQELRVKVDVDVTYPADHGAQFFNEKRTLTRTASVRLADTPRAGTTYGWLCRGGTFAGALWLGLMSLVLVLAARAFRHEAFPPRAVAEPEEDEDEEYLRRPMRRRRIRDDD